ncbi:helix-turn-helix domain-containing protein [Telluria beijingensis]|uniref:helix-turn-helix domain-containing protein n=1 Tax=Telluria beijingensis TaxID=3068633 RepID=UPI002795BC17|nr:helix-turn-helix transcriptional regulator [Massilia sp. REN29]
MKTHDEVAKVLRTAIDHRGVSQARLREEAAISQRTLTNVLSGTEDFKMSTLFSLADRLGLEMVLVPKSVVQAVSAGPVSQPMVKTRVQKALELSMAQKPHVNRKG